MCLGPHQNQGWGWRRETGLSPPLKYLTDRSKAVLLLWIFYVFSVLCLLCLCARLFICALWSPAGKGLTSWLSFVVYNCEFVTFPLVSWVRCGTWFIWFLIFAPLLILNTLKIWVAQQILRQLKYTGLIVLARGITTAIAGRNGNHSLLR